MDLVYTGYLLMVSALVLFGLGKRLGTLRPTLSHVLGCSSVLVAFWLAWNSGQSFRWAQWIPHSSVLIICNAPVILLVLAAGLFFGCHQGSCRKRQLISFGLCSTAALFLGMAIWRPIYQPLDFPLAGQWKDEVCLQTHPSTCAPAAVATLANQHGIKTTERDMAAACLTSNQGTLALGSFRGTYLVSRNSSLKPQVVVCQPKLYPARQLDSQLPMLVHVNFEQQLYESLLTPSRFSGGTTRNGRTPTARRPSVIVGNRFRLWNARPSWQTSRNEGHVVVVMEKERRRKLPSC